MEKLEKISYDLSQNFLSQEDQFVRLEHYSLILLSGYFWKSSFKPEIRELKTVLIDKENCDNKLATSLTTVLTEYVYVRILYVSSNLRIGDCFMRSTIRFVLGEIINFYNTAKPYFREDFNLIIRHIAFTNQGTVNTKRTVLQILNKEKLSTYRKFCLAAQFFLEDKAKQYYDELTPEQKTLLSAIEVDNDFALNYWIWKITGKRNRIKNMQSWSLSKKGYLTFCTVDKLKQNSDLIHQHLFLMALKEHNEMAVHYLWENFISKLYVRSRLIKEFLPEYMTKFTHANIIMYLTFEVMNDELSDFLNEQCAEIQVLVFLNQRWRVVFKKFFEALLKPKNSSIEYYYVLHGIAAYLNEGNSDIDLELLNYFLSKLPARQIFTGKFQDTEVVLFHLLYQPIEEANFYLAANILKCGSKEYNFQFLTSSLGMRLIETSLRNSKFEFTNNILKINFKKEDIKKIKYEVLRSKAVEICCFLVFKGVHMLESFGNWLSDSIDSSDMDEFWSRLPFQNGGMFVKLIIPNLSYEPTTALEWCVGKEGFESVKSKISLHIEEKTVVKDETIKLYDMVFKLVVNSEYFFILALAKWKGCTTEDKLKLGIKLLRDSNLFQEILEQNNPLEWFEKFCDFLCFNLGIPITNEDLVSLKAKIFNTRTIFLPLVHRWELEKIIHAIEWLTPTNKKILKLGEYLEPILIEHFPGTEEAEEMFKTFYSTLYKRHPHKLKQMVKIQNKLFLTK
ncbi:UNVERIFIED_CONTAM: hypothetical protein RMT77_018617 [Armadillidium vulgare]